MTPSPLPSPLISVVMPVLDGARHLAEAVDSILAQTCADLELVVVDDGSTDDTPAILRALAARDPRIRPAFPGHGGVARALNTGVAMARGLWLARMDADDVALPDRLERQLAWMRERPVDVCGCCVQRFGLLSGFYWFPESHEAIRSELLFRVALLHPTVVAPLAVFRANPYDVEARHEDYELWTRLALRYRLGNTPQILLRHRVHPAQVSRVSPQALRDDVSRFRRPYFHALFPEASREDYAAVALAAERRPAGTLAELARAGEWLLRLARGSDIHLRQRMAERWLDTCTNAAPLGPRVHALHRQYAPRFAAPRRSGTHALRIACLLRLSSSSWLRLSWRRAKRSLGRRGRRAGAR